MTTIQERYERLIPQFDRTRQALDNLLLEDRANSVAMFTELVILADKGRQPAATCIPQWIGS